MKIKRISFVLLFCAIFFCGCTQHNNPSQVYNSPSQSAEQVSEVLTGTESEKNNKQTTEMSNYEFEIQELYAQRGENKIYGVIYIPQNAGDKMPTVIFSHGFGGNYQVGSGYAEALAKKGYVVYCFDFCGGSTGSKSDGSTLEMSIFTEQQDLEAVLGMIQEQPFVDSSNIFLIGTSMGGAVSAITAANHEEEIKGAILLYPAFVLVDDAKERFASVEDIPDTYYQMWMTVGHVFAEDLLDYDIYGAISAYKKDVLLIHGDADNIVPISYSKKAVEVYDSARLEILSGAGHGFYGNDAEQAVDWILEYLENNSYESVEGTQIKMITENTEVIITLNASKAAADLVAMLPLEMTLVERNAFAKGMTLPKKLSATEATTRDYSIGDFGYWNSGPDLAIFYDDIYEETIVEVIPLGHAKSGAETMANEAGTVRLELADEKET